MFFIKSIVVEAHRASFMITQKYTHKHMWCKKRNIGQACCNGVNMGYNLCLVEVEASKKRWKQITWNFNFILYKNIFHPYHSVLNIQVQIHNKQSMSNIERWNNFWNRVILYWMSFTVGYAIDIRHRLSDTQERDHWAWKWEKERRWSEGFGFQVISVTLISNQHDIWFH